MPCFFQLKGIGFRPLDLGGCRSSGVYWAAVKELNLSYCIGKTILFTVHHTQYGNLIQISQQQP